MAEPIPTTKPGEVTSDATADTSTGFAAPPKIDPKKMAPAPKGSKGAGFVLPKGVVGEMCDAPNQIAYAFTNNPQYPLTAEEKRMLDDVGNPILSKYLAKVEYADLFLFAWVYVGIEVKHFKMASDLARSQKNQAANEQERKQPERSSNTQNAPAPDVPSPRASGLPPAVQQALAGKR